MNNFLEFISEDVEAKKSLISLMPIKNKADKKKYNDKIDLFSGKYEQYHAAVKKYIDTKSKSFCAKLKNNNLDELKEKVRNLEHVRFIINPMNTYIEKMGFDTLFYEIGNYHDFNFNSLINCIDKFIDKFNIAKIELVSKDFNYTCYVKEFMKAYFEEKDNEENSHNKLSETFEKIYWVNPDIIHHIELNFRKLIKKNEKKLEDYIGKYKKEIIDTNNIKNYEECMYLLKDAYIELKEASNESINDVISLAKQGSIDINNYFEDSKIRTTTYSEFMIDSINLDDKVLMNKFYESLRRLKSNIEEYKNYLLFIPLFENFITEYKPQVVVDESSAKSFKLYEVENEKKVKSIYQQIAEKETKLDKLNNKIVDQKEDSFDSKKSKDSKQFKLESIKMAKELYELYKESDHEYFKKRVVSILSNSLTIEDILHLYYSFDFFKKSTIRKVFNISNHDEIVKYSEDFDLFAMDPTNIIIRGVSLFEKNELSKVIINKYRLDNISLSEDMFDEDGLDSIVEKAKMLLRINTIDESTLTVEKIWFIVQVEKLNKDVNKS